MIAGATGYVGGALAHRLLEDGVSIRALARTPQKAAHLEAAGADVVKGDVLEPETLGPALAGAGVAYYLVHSMGRGGDGDFAARDAEAAKNFGEGAAKAGLDSIVYLGGLAEEGSEHLESRHATAGHLGEAGVPVTYFQAAAVVGGGSESFLTVYYLVKRLPLMLAPAWTKTSTQPIGVDDVVAYLAAAPAVPEATGRRIEIGGPDVTTYGGMMDAVAEAMDKRARPRIPVPVLSPWLSSHWIGLVTPVDAGVAQPIAEGLAVETVVRDPSGMELFDVEPTTLAETMRRAVEEIEDRD